MLVPYIAWLHAYHSIRINDGVVDKMHCIIIGNQFRNDEYYSHNYH